MLRAVIDTNTWVSGLVWSGPPRQIIRLALADQLRCVSCTELVSEFRRVLAYERIDKVLRKRGLSASELVSQFSLVTDLVQAPPLPQSVCRDPDDDIVLACAVAAPSVDLIISGDADLLILGQYRGIPILDAAQAMTHFVDAGGQAT